MRDLSSDELARLADYLAHETPPEEVARVEQWVAENPAIQAVLRGLSHSRDTGSDTQADAAVASQVEILVQTVMAQVGDGTKNLPAVASATRSSLVGARMVGGSKTRTLRRWVWSIGAVVGIAIVYGIFGLAKRTNPGTVRTYATGSGQQATLTLNDGSRVTLAPRTTLRVRFGAASRTVELDGQGYFEVASSRGVPFLVRSGTMTTQVLGTSFLVRHYANDAQVHVAVAEGKVGITSERTDRWLTSSPVTLTAGHVGDITDSTVHVSTVDDLTPETDWLRGRLVFRHVSVGNVLQTLNRWYGYQFRCSDSTLIQQQVTLSLNARSSAAALSTLEQFLSVRLTVVGDTITLTPYVNRATTGVSRKRAYDVWIPTREAGR